MNYKKAAVLENTHRADCRSLCDCRFRFESQHETMQWAKNLRVENEHYRLFTSTEFQNVVTFFFDNGQLLTIDDLKSIVQKGQAIPWEDFAAYDERNVGFGLYIMLYSMAKPYYVTIGGIPEETPHRKWTIQFCRYRKQLCYGRWFRPNQSE